MRQFGTVIAGLMLISIALETRSQSVNHWDNIIKASDTWKYLVPTSQPDSLWRYGTFNDDSWNSGSGGFGYGDGDDGTIVPNGTISVFIRRKFSITDTSKIENLILNADYDDAFVAYINGIEIGRSSGLTSKYPVFDEKSVVDHEAVMYTNGSPEYYTVSHQKIRQLLVNGENVLAVQIHNVLPTSSDLSGNFFLTAGIKDSSVIFGPTPSWFQAPEELGISNLPIILINTNGQIIPDSPKITAHMSIIDNGVGMTNHVDDPPNNYDGRIGVEIRGSSSQLFPKKSYSLETRTDLDSNLNVSLLGLPAENDWILYAPYTDKSLLRNTVVYKLGNEMGHYAPRTKYCEVYLNNDYIGIYVLTEKIKQGKNRVDISKLKKTDVSGNDVTGGYILKIDKTTGDENEGWYSNYKTKYANSYIEFLYDYPKPSDIATQQKSYIINYLTQFENVLASDHFSDTISGYQQFTDVSSFADYFLMNEISKNVDGYRISTYIHKNRADKDGKLVAGPLWDYDISCGNANYYDGQNYKDWFFNSNFNSQDNWQVPFWWERFLQDSHFCSIVRAHYTQFRQNILKTENIIAYIDSMALSLNEAQSRNFTKWPILGTYIWPNYYIGNSYQDEINYLKNWLSNRLLWIDSNLSNILLSNENPLTPIVSDLAVVYPNPFNEYFNIEIFPYSEARKATIELFDLTGKKVFTDITPVDGFQKTIYSLPAHNQFGGTLSSGMYLLKIKLDSGKEFQSKIVKK